MKKKINYILSFVSLFALGISNVLAGSFYEESEGTLSICGFSDMSPRVPMFTSGLYTIIKIFVPIILVIMGMTDFLRAVMASDEDKISKTKKTFITRLIAAVIVFFVMTIVQFVFSNVNKSETKGFTGCMDCLLSNHCGQKTIVKKKTCEEYSKKNKCPATDDFGHSCKTAGYNSGIQCRTKGKECSDFSKSECNGSQTTAGAICEYVGTMCLPKCSSLGMSSCTGRCKWDGSISQCKEKEIETTKSSTTSSNTGKNTNSTTSTRVFVGDSRTVGMCQAVTGKSSECDSTSFTNNDDVFISSVGKGYSWFTQSSVQNNITSNAKSGVSIIILMGVNDVGSTATSGTAAADKYINYLNSSDKIDSWKNKGAKVYYVSINPVIDGKSNAYNAAIDAFNSKMKSFSKITYIDTNSAVKFNNSDISDGLHYSSNKNKEIYQYIVSNT